MKRIDDLQHDVRNVSDNVLGDLDGDELTEAEKRRIFRQGRVGRAILKLDERQRKRRDRERPDKGLYRPSGETVT